MREVLLNGLLALQVLASVILTGVLMYRPALAIQPADPPLAASLQPALAPETPPDLTLPRAVWVHQGGGRYLAAGPAEPLYQRAWRQMRPVLARLMARPLIAETPSPLELAQAATMPLLGADLPAALPAGDWARLWDAAGNGGFVGPGRGSPAAGREGLVDRVVFRLAPPGEVYLLGTRGAARLHLAEADRAELADLVRSVDPQAYPAMRLLAGPGADTAPFAPEERDSGGLTEFAPWILVPDGPVSAATTLLLPQRKEAQAYLHRFFPDVSVVRQIQEQDGSVAYTDGQRGMRLYANGALEYFEPREGTDPSGPDLFRALQVAQEFISARRLWPPGATLAAYARLGQEARLTFGVRGPALLWVSPRPPLEVRVAGNRVVYFYRGPDFEVRASAGNDRLITAEEALNQVKLAAAGRTLRVRSLFLAHRPEPAGLPVLIPVWVVGLQDGDMYVVDARLGRVL